MLLSGLIFTRTTIFFFILLIILEITLKGIALYRAGNRKDIWRFICLFVFNTCGILPIIYLLLTNEDVNKKPEQKKDNIESLKSKNNNTKSIKKAKKGGVVKGKSTTKSTGPKSKKK